jgi:hypothetical protein
MVLFVFGVRKNDWKGKSEEARDEDCSSRPTFSNPLIRKRVNNMKITINIRSPHV